MSDDAVPEPVEVAAAVPDIVHPDVPNVARMYDWALGGAHHFAVDRERAEQVAAAYPQGVASIWANRRFLRHAVEHLLTRGIDQFLDLGSGIPTVGNVHQVALERDPGARVAYVDHEPVAVAHSRAILDGVTHATVTAADLRDVDTVLTAPGVARHLDLSRPVALLAVAVLHFVGDEDDPSGVLARYRAALAPGSVLALSHTSYDYPDHPDLAAQRAQLLSLYSSTSNPLHDRSRAQIRAIVEDAGFPVADDGLVPVDRWGSAGDGDAPLGMYTVISEPTTAP